MNLLIPTSGLLMRTIPLHDSSGACGTAFIAPASPADLIVTAIHNLSISEGKASARVFYQETWHGVELTLHARSQIIDGDDLDGVGVFRSSPPISYPAGILPIPTGLAHIVIGQPVFIAGFPSNIPKSPPMPNSPIHLPMIRSGIVSSWIPDTMPDTIYVDAMSYPGMSGSPVAYFNTTSNKVQVAGICTGVTVPEPQSLESMGFMRVTRIPDF